jgi:Tfp pilus assembly protein PilN
MIRVNLLGAKEPAARGGVFSGGAEPGIPSEPSEKSGLLLAILVLGGSLAFIGYQWWSAKQAINKLDQEIASLNQEKARLATIIAQVKEYQRQLDELKQKEELIQRLMSEREGPVIMLDQLSAQLPDFIWLTTLTQTGTGVAVNGMAASYVSIADYIRKLEDTDYFRDVELIDARQDKSEFTSFQLRAQVVIPRPPQQGADQQPAAEAGSR